MYGCESWTIKKAEHWRIDAFELWCWRKLLRVTWTAGRSNQSILKEISPEYSFEGLMLSWNSNTLATWCKELTHWKRPWCWERLKVGGEGNNREWDGWMASPIQWTWIWASYGSWWWTGKPGLLQSMGLQRVRHNWATELNWKHWRSWCHRSCLRTQVRTFAGIWGWGLRQDLWSKAFSFPEMNYKNSNYSVLWIITYNLWMRWRRKSQPTPVFLPGKSHGQRSLVGYSPWGPKELDTTERLHFLFFLKHLS